ncbi:M24 family metallopeptidase [Streptomyces sp. 2A115]|uniref:M24 family metallopeptidase n=1 Tax=Streptomyces sp. 2A115 TaxID=3457439 RepID=UPI003FD55895
MESLFPQIDYQPRLSRLRASLQLDEGSAYLATDLTNIRYLSGFSGSSGKLLITADSAVMFTDGRYVEAAEAEVPSGLVSVHGGDRAGQWTTMVESVKNFAKLFFDAHDMTVDFFLDIRSELGSGVEMVDSRRAVEKLRIIKSPAEIARMKAAAQISGTAFSALPSLLKEGVTERGVASFLEKRMIDLGAEALAFPSIVASGENSSRPHAHPSNRKVLPGELVVIDFGARVDGYHADITRTIWAGSLDDAQLRMHRAVVEANAAGVAAVRPGATHADIFRACRSVLSEYGYQEPPAHPFGHNLGLFIHELPFLTDSADEPLMPGQIITVEPGIYFKGFGGVRIEDMVLVTPEGHQMVSDVPVQTV